jgi:hypothetical protein
VSRYGQFVFGARFVLGGLGWLWAACLAVWAGEEPGDLAPRVRATIVQVEHPGATVAFEAQPPAVQDMVRRGMLQWSGKTDLAAAWLSVVSPKDVVGLKV